MSTKSILHLIQKVAQAPNIIMLQHVYCLILVLIAVNLIVFPFLRLINSWHWSTLYFNVPNLLARGTTCQWKANVRQGIFARPLDSANCFLLNNPVNWPIHFSVIVLRKKMWKLGFVGNMNALNLRSASNVRLLCVLPFTHLREKKKRMNDV